MERCMRTPRTRLTFRISSTSLPLHVKIPPTSSTKRTTMPDIDCGHSRRYCKAFKKINPNKAGGPDMIPARVLKEIAEEISPLLTVIFQTSLGSGTVADDWRSANVTATFKEGDRFKASNYRSVSLTSLCFKVQQHITTSNIPRHLEEHDILTVNMDSVLAAAVKPNKWHSLMNLQRPRIVRVGRRTWSSLIFPRLLIMSPIYECWRSYTIMALEAPQFHI